MKTLTMKKQEFRIPQAQARKLLSNLVWGAIFTIDIVALLSLIFDSGDLLWFLLVR